MTAVLHAGTVPPAARMPNAMPYSSHKIARSENVPPPATLPSVRRDAGSVNSSAAQAPSVTTATGACHTTS